MAVTLVCECGKRLKAPGAVPGRVGRCPACGGTLRVPDAVVSDPEPLPDSEPLPGYALGNPVSPPRMESPRPVARRKKRPADSEAPLDRGLVRPPSSAESSVWTSLAFPLWGSAGIAMLAAMPPFFWITSLLSLGLIPNYVIGQDDVMVMGALTMVAPMLAIGLLGSGYLGIFLERILIDAAAGEVVHPRMPSWALGRMIVNVWRLGAALAIGCAPMAAGASFYVQGLDAVQAYHWVLIALAMAPGLVYAQFALASVALRDSVLAANPGTVLGSLARAPGAAVGLAIGLLVPTTLAILLAVALFIIGKDFSGNLAVLLTYAFWLAIVYGSMVSARVLGNFCRTHRRALGWYSA